MNTEEWRDIPEYEGLYRVSNNGRIMSVNRRVEYMKEGKLHSHFVRGKIKKPYLNDHNGHYYNTLYKDNKPFQQQVGYFILSAFVGAKPEGDNVECSHLDGDALNNKVSNLAWEEHKDNMARKYEHGTVGIGNNSPHHVLNDDKVITIKKQILLGKYTQGDIALYHGVAQSTISTIKHNLIWSHVPWPIKESA